MTRQSLSLTNLTWQFGHVPRRPFTAAEVYDLSYVAEWLPATVPGNVRTDLLALGRISDPYVAEQYRESLWVEGLDWWYRCRIEWEEPDSSRTFLHFAGIDYLSAIFVNGRELSRHEGMFSSQWLEITEALRANGGEVEVAVRLWGSEALPRRRLNLIQQVWQKVAGRLHGSWVGVYPDRSATLKSQMSFGWDFAPPIRTMGIWDEAHLVTTGPVCMVEASLLGRPDPQVSLADRHFAPADLRLDLGIVAAFSTPATARVILTPANFSGNSIGPFDFPLHFPAGPSRLKLRCSLPEVALWQPWDRGDPHLYHVTLSLIHPNGHVLDELNLRTGFRRVELECWQFRLNGRREFMRGLNWVPADIFPGRLRRGDYSRLLTLARQSGANLLRVWGGGLREKGAFYDLCDELGLLVWQEFPFACMFLGSFPQDKAYLALVEAECGAIIRRLQAHPSLILWCGGNEFSRTRNRPLLKTLASLVRRDDETRPFIPVSPAATSSGADSHNWQVWHGLAPFRTFQAESAHFLSEFGLQALPHRDTLTTTLPHPLDPTTWPTHHADLDKLFRYLIPFMKQKELEELRELASPLLPCSPALLLSLISASQLAQALALQTAIEHMRRRKGEAGGVCLWQLNEPWPAISWAIVDYFGRPKLAYERLSTWYNPVLVCLEFPIGQEWQPGETFTADIWAINDSLHAYPTCHLEIDLDGQRLYTGHFDLPPDSARSIGHLRHTFSAPPHRLTLTLRCETDILCRNQYPLHWFDASPRPIAYQLRRWLADLVLQ